MVPGFSCFGNYGGYSWIGMFVSLALVTVVVIGVIWLVRRSFFTNQEYMVTAKSSPGEILQIRYAQGEITREQYLEILDDLKE